MLTATAVATWLTGLGVTVPVLPGPLPAGTDTLTPDMRLLVAPAPGAPPEDDGVFDTLGFQFHVRGPATRLYDDQAFTAAMDTDVRVRLADVPCRIGGTYVASVMRMGGPPTSVAGPDSSERLVYSATYLFTYAVL